MTATTLLIRYSFFAVVATLTNLGVQRIALWLGGLILPRLPDGLLLSGAILAGTGAGLLLKYFLDKRWIFGDVETGLAAHSRKLGLYTAMGIATTAIFWTFEYSAWLLWGTTLAREAGAVVGLAIGYAVKYWLDRRFVFRPGTGKRVA